MSEQLEKRLVQHMDRDETVFTKISADIEKIKENHLAHIQASMHAMQEDITVVTTDVTWLKRFFFIVATASVGSLVTGLLAIALRSK